MFNIFKGKPDVLDLAQRIIPILESIDKRLSTLENTVRPGVKHRPNTASIVTSHWND